MDAWARSYGQRVNFLAIGCAGRQTAQMQKNRLNLTDCTVGFVSRQSDGPFWGQLGCNGFIILDGSDEQRVVSKATSPFNMVRNLGFKHVESLLDALLADQPLPVVCPGQFVRLHSLTKAPQLNDQIALCFDNKRGDRFPVQLLQDGRQLAVKVKNFSVIADPEAALEAQRNSSNTVGVSSGGCANGQCGGPCESKTVSSSSCSNGSCEAKIKSCESTNPNKPTQSVPDLIQQVESVGVPEMDSEHDECVDALNRLATNHSRPNLQRALDIITDHFAHEEKYMQQKVKEQELKTSNMMSFSSASDAFKTHAAEHSRFLRMIQDELKNQRKPSGSFVASLLDEFTTHIVQFDNYGPTAEDSR